jgi:ATPase subunit of ABC transporter with duplicated ATPase domains
VLDEPFNALDAAGSELLERELPAGRTVLLATHDPQRVESVATNRLAFA